MNWQRGLILILGLVFMSHFGIIEAGAVVWCQGDDLGDRKSQEEAAQASQRVCEAVSHAFLMLGYIDVAKFDPSANKKAQTSRSHVIEKLDEAIKGFSGLLKNRSFLNAADKVILQKDPADFAGRLRNAEISRADIGFFQPTMEEAMQTGSKAIFNRAIKELENAKRLTIGFNPENPNILNMREPRIIWSYIRMWNNLVFVGRGLSALFYEQR